MNFLKFLRIPFLQSASGRLLLGVAAVTRAYLGLTVVFVWSGAQRVKFNFCFSKVFC